MSASAAPADARTTDGAWVSTMHDRRPTVGLYDVVDAGPGISGQAPRGEAGQAFSYQRHRSRPEHWYVVAGGGIVTLDGVGPPVGPGEAVDITVGAAHRATNTGRSEELVLIEVRTGSYFGEDDMIRLDDDYGRCRH